MPPSTLPRLKTDAAVRGLGIHSSGKQVEYSVEGVRGLSVRVSAQGVKTWSLRYRNAASDQQRHTLGIYPDVSLSAARTAAQSLLGKIADGVDPADEKRKSKSAAIARKLATVADLVERYFEAAARGKHRANARPKRESTLSSERSYYSRFIKPRLGKVAVTGLSRAEVQSLVDEIEATSPAGARITRNVIRQAFNFGIEQEVTDHNPAARINVVRWQDRERVLSDEELRAVWSTCDQPRDLTPPLDLGPGMAIALKLALVTLQRGGEVTGIHAREIDRAQGTWTIPSARTKNHRSHIVPLSSLALDLLDQAFMHATGSQSTEWKGFAFPSPRGKASITRHALSRAMQRIRDHKAVKIADATPHDFRRTGATLITGERIGIPRFIVSRVLNQISDTGGAAVVTGVYDRNNYMAEKRRALDAWASLLSEIITKNQRSPNVIVIPPTMAS